MLQGSSEASTKAFGDEFVKVGMSASKTCGQDDNTCFSYSIRNGLEGVASAPLKNTLSPVIDIDKLYTFISTRGTSFALYSFGLGCLNSSNASDASSISQYRSTYSFTDANEDISKNPMNNICGIIVIDVNGASSPNQWGRDVFGLWITDNGKLDLTPFGNKNDKKLREDSCTENNSLGCAATIINAGWEMKY